MKRAGELLSILSIILGRATHLPCSIYLFEPGLSAFLFYCWHSSWVMSLYLLLILSGPPVWNLLLGSGLPSLRLGPCILLLQGRVLPRIQSFRLVVHANLWQNEMCSWKVTVPVMFLNGIILNAVGSLLFKGHWEWGLLQNAAFSQGKL